MGQRAKRTTARPERARFTSASTWLMIGLVFLSAFLLYANAIRHDYTLDDWMYTTENTYVRQGFSAFRDVWTRGLSAGFSGLNDHNYRPLALSSFMVETQIFGFDPHVSHFVNVLLFAFTCVLIYVLLARLFPTLNRVFPLLMVLLFVVHPVHVEAVANIKGRDDLLCLFFGIVSLLLVHRYSRAGQAATYWSAVLAFAACVLSKESGVTFLLVIPLVLYFFTSVAFARIVKITIPFLVVVLLYLVVRNSVLGGITSGALQVMNNALMAATSRSDMLATNFVLLGKYVYLLVVPYPLSWDYSYNQIPIVSFANVWAIAGLVLYLGLGAYAVARSTSKDVFAFAILFYLVTLSISSNLFVKISATFAERLLYTPSLGFCIAIPLLIAKLSAIDPGAQTVHKPQWLFGIVGPVLLTFGVILVTRNEAWANNMTLFSAGVITSPNSARAQAALGNEFKNEANRTPDPAKRGDLLKQALGRYETAAAIYPDDPETWARQADLYRQTGDSDKAIRTYEKSLAIDPQFTRAMNGLGLTYCDRKDYDKGIVLFEQALARSPQYTDALVNLGAAYHGKGDFQNAIKAYTKSLTLQPDNPLVLKNLANVYSVVGATYFNAGDWGKALSNFTEASTYAPDSASIMTNIGSVYVNMGNLPKAIEFYTKALSIDPANAEARQHLAHIEATSR
jgi:tetratricopeptide (TPR) repeat protein